MEDVSYLRPYSNDAHPSSTTARRIPIPTQSIRIAIFDMDGVVTQTSKAHSWAWKQMLDEFLVLDARAFHRDFVPFDNERDYELYISGVPRLEGLATFLKSRDIELPLGSPEDEEGVHTLYGLGNRKNNLYLNYLSEGGIEVFPSTVERIQEFRERSIKTAIISASRNCVEVLSAVHLLDLFDTKVDGNDSERLGIKGKPAPDIFLQAARQLGISPQQGIVFEDAIAGVQAARAGGFAWVIGINRSNVRREMGEAGATHVVDDLEEVYLE